MSLSFVGSVLSLALLLCSPAARAQIWTPEDAVQAALVASPDLA